MARKFLTIGFVRRFTIHTRGNVALLFALSLPLIVGAGGFLVVPVLAVMALLSHDVWQNGRATQKAAAAVDIAVEYYFNGGTSDSRARQAALDGWPDRSPDATVEISRKLGCGGTTTVSELCPDGSKAETYVTIDVEGSTQGMLYKPTVRLRRSARVR